MPATAKFKDGPWKGKAMAVQHSLYPGATLEINGIKEDTKVNRWDPYAPYAPMSISRGTYVATHVVLKNGDRVCKWIGWTDGTF